MRTAERCEPPHRPDVLVAHADGPFVGENCLHVLMVNRREAALVELAVQELPLELFQTVFSSLRFSRGLFGKKADDQYLIRLLKDLSLIEKKNEIMKL